MSDDAGACDSAYCVCYDCGSPCRGYTERHTSLTSLGEPTQCSVCVCEQEGAHEVAEDQSGAAWCERCSADLGVMA
jgi:hypothetical protein